MNKLMIVCFFISVWIFVACQDQSKDSTNKEPSQQENSGEDQEAQTNPKENVNEVSPEKEGTENMTEWKIEVLAQGTNSGHPEKKDYVIQDKEAFQKLWSQVHQTMDPTPEMPQVDFSQEMVLAVFQGQKNSGGYEIEITDIGLEGEKLKAMVKETSPDSGSMMMSVMTQPFFIAKTKKTDKEVQFVRESSK